MERSGPRWRQIVQKQARYSFSVPWMRWALTQVHIQCFC
jgi:hypothetical protein